MQRSSSSQSASCAGRRLRQEPRAMCSWTCRQSRTILKSGSRQALSREHGATTRFSPLRHGSTRDSRRDASQETSSGAPPCPWTDSAKRCSMSGSMHPSDTSQSRLATPPSGRNGGKTQNMSILSSSWARTMSPSTQSSSQAPSSAQCSPGLWSIMSPQPSISTMKPESSQRAEAPVSLATTPAKAESHQSASATICLQTARRHRTPSSTGTTLKERSTTSCLQTSATFSTEPSSSSRTSLAARSPRSPRATSTTTTASSSQTSTPCSSSTTPCSTRSISRKACAASWRPARSQTSSPRP
eukprot:comp21925_c0_seq1/m.49916 comp21925_c0_seq1/g.49916  ORF comp21925_c0_seq1/g.49916 comp21925_c0_seq1/m.49916 type:complete len:300 (+) comp21925_c0_seq1:545-1444(+)